jgi:hypothetical protein
MSTSKGNLLTSPVGEIVFMAAENPVRQSKSDDKLVYTSKLAFDNKKDKAWLAEVSAINDAKVVTARSYRGKDEKLIALLESGKSLVGANSKFKPTIYDAKGNQLEEAPLFFGDSKGTAQMIVEPYIGAKGGTINLISIIVHSIENAEGTSPTGDSRETRLAQLRAAVDAATKG